MNGITLIDRIENRMIINKLKIDQKTVIPFIYIAIILIGFDLVITYAGMKYGLEEGNIITLFFINRLGDLYGLVASMIGKSLIIISPLIAYRFVEKELNKSFKNISMKNIYWIHYTLLIVVAIITTLYTDINNLMILVSRLEELYII